MGVCIPFSRWPYIYLPAPASTISLRPYTMKGFCQTVWKASKVIGNQNMFEISINLCLCTAQLFISTTKRREAIREAHKEAICEGLGETVDVGAGR